ncbi:hypothetical protein QS257_09380 [Terrilactibacillus sp. S3-3]|nr:hypothetical protein QS257_09380 [Terrilactibacillus sp. S3-3]
MLRYIGTMAGVKVSGSLLNLLLKYSGTGLTATQDFLHAFSLVMLIGTIFGPSARPAPFNDKKKKYLQNERGFCLKKLNTYH